MDNWIDDLMDTIDEILADSKRVKFNTHRNRKTILGEIKTAITNASNEHAGNKHLNTRKDQMITRPKNDHKPVGFAVMTEGLSSKGDEVHKGY